MSGHQQTAPSRVEQRQVAQHMLKEMYAAAKQTWQGLQDRPAQKRVMGSILSTLLNYQDNGVHESDSNTLLLEAGTGFGKTLAYGLPAMAASFATGHRIVISTATVALQEQLFERDLPRMAQIAARCGFEVPFTLLKGRGRYLCNEKLDATLMRLQSQPSSQHDSNPGTQPIQLFRNMAHALKAKQWNGDRDNWNETISDEQWASVQAERANCSGRHCPSYQSCAFYTARSSVREARVIVANHSLVLSTLATEASLFKPNETFFIFDEGHHMNSIAVQHFAPSYGLESVRKSFEALRKEIRTAVAVTGHARLAEALASTQETLDYLILRHTGLADELAEVPEYEQPGVFRFEHGVLPEGLVEVGLEMQPYMQSVVDLSYDAMNVLRDSLKGHPNTKKVTECMNNLGPAAMKINTMLTLWNYWLDQTEIPYAKWLQVTINGRYREISLCASSLTSAEDLHRNLWSKAAASIVASATLAENGTFDYFKRMTGLDRMRVQEVIAESPFDYRSQGQLHIVKTHNLPNRPEFTQEVARLLPDLIKRSNRGQLALFTSRDQMFTVYEAMPDHIKCIVLMQDQLPKGQLLAEHIQRVQSGQPSVIFGLQSFGEGVDLPGELCEHVYIDKIPFSPPGNPVDQALEEWLKSIGRKPFDEVSVPQASQTLKQWVGRAVRTTQDVATVTIFDPRLLTHRYGERLLKALPPMPVQEHESW